MKVLIAGGGTGGHLFPGIAVADELKDRGISQEILFAGTEHGIEARVIPKEGYPLRFVRAEGIVGKSLPRKIRGLFIFLLSLWDSHRVLHSFKPDIVIGVGGYASVGMVLMARASGVPTIILEQNSVPGLANRFLGRFVDAIAVTYQESISFFPKGRTYLTGNPIRKRILRKNDELARSLFPLAGDRFTVLIFGGSAGARSINQAMIDALPHLVAIRDNIQFVHQTGAADHEAVTGAYRKYGFRGIVVPFIYEMAEAYTVADMVVCRAGASTLSELTAVGKPAVLIPYPYAASSHQEYNARKLEDMGAARMIRDRDLNGEVMASSIRKLYADEGLRRDMQKAAVAFGKIDAAERVVALTVNLTKRST